MATKTVSLNGQKYQLISIEKGTKVPTGLETIQWDGQDYILSPIVTPAPKVEEVSKEEKAPGTTKTQERSSFPWWLAVLALILFGIVLWLIFRPCTVSSTGATTVAPAVGGTSAVDAECYASAGALDAPADMIRAICDPVPGNKGVSNPLPVGTVVKIGSITFDGEHRVWFLKDFTTPAIANYAFSYDGAERQLFSAPFVTGAELGFAKDGTRTVPFTICWDTLGECQPPADLFPNQ